MCFEDDTYTNGMVVMACSWYVRIWGEFLTIHATPSPPPPLVFFFLSGDKVVHTRVSNHYNAHIILLVMYSKYGIVRLCMCV